MDNRRGLPDDVKEDNTLKGEPRNNMNDRNPHRNHNEPLARELISEAEAQRMRNGFTHRHAPESTVKTDHSQKPQFHDSGEVGKAPNMYADGANSYR